MPDTFDLDALFAHLESDIAGASSPRGAALSVSTARRRRRTTIGATLAGVAVVAAAVAVGAGAGSSDHGVEPVTQLPAPAPFDGALLTTATAGWTPAWGPETTAARNKIAQSFGGPCVANIPGGGTRGALSALATSHDDVALAEMTDFGSRTAKAQTAWRHVERQLQNCRSAELVSSFTTSSGAAGHTYRIDPNESESAPEYAWIVTTGREVGELKIFGQSDPLPATHDPMVARAFLAAIQDPDSYTPVPSTDQPPPRVEEGDFARALGGWRSGWARSVSRVSPALASPCYSPRWHYRSSASKHESLGRNGRQDMAVFASAAAARAAAASVIDAVRACGEASYAVTRSLDSPSRTLAVGSGPMVVWVARHDDVVGVVRVPSAGTAPPPQVTTQVGSLMFAAVTAFAAEGR